MNHFNDDFIHATVPNLAPGMNTNKIEGLILHMHASRIFFFFLFVMNTAALSNQRTRSQRMNLQYNAPDVQRPRLPLTTPHPPTMEWAAKYKLALAMFAD